jgi:delta(3,5)-delta(2,4)-dienoyl-CoA isomerase
MQGADPGRTGLLLRRHIEELQNSLTAIEKCDKPVIAAVHGLCLGAGIDIIAACDVRYCCKFDKKRCPISTTMTISS